MTSVNGTITSKNQLSLPISLVRKYKLDKNRAITFTDRNGVIEIRPQASLRERMQKHWDEFHRTHPDGITLTDDKIHTEVRDAYEKHYQQVADE